MMKQTPEDRLSAIEERNERVTLDKAWETSWVRRGSIAVLSYAIIASLLFITDTGRPLLGAIVPVVGYLLSTLVIGRLKEWWIEAFERKRMSKSKK